MEFEFDPAKDEANLFKHRLRLAFGQRVFDDPFFGLTPTIRVQRRRGTLEGDRIGRRETLHGDPRLAWRGRQVDFGAQEQSR